jgi:hypothetical protein
MAVQDQDCVQKFSIFARGRLSFRVLVGAWRPVKPFSLWLSGLNLKDWIDANLGGRVTPPTEAITWLSIFAQSAWALWSWRNNTLFETSFSRP